jgi:hypothetical protein
VRGLEKTWIELMLIATVTILGLSIKPVEG